MDAGIYKITNLVNNKSYVGQSVRLQQRLNDHRNRLKCNKHYNQHLQRSYNKYGIENFKFEVIKYVDDRKELAKWEEYYIEYYTSYNSEFGFNRTRYINEVPIPSEETRKLWSEQRKGRTTSEYQKQRASEFSKNRIFTDEQKLAISKGQCRKPKKTNTTGEHNIHLDPHSNYYVEFRPNKKSFKVGSNKDLSFMVLIRELFFSYPVNLLHQQRTIFNQIQSTHGYFGLTVKKNYFISVFRANRKEKTIKSSNNKEICAEYYNNYILENNINKPLNIIPFDKGVWNNNQWYCNLP